MLLSVPSTMFIRPTPTSLLTRPRQFAWNWKCPGPWSSLSNRSTGASDSSFIFYNLAEFVFSDLEMHPTADGLICILAVNHSSLPWLIPPPTRENSQGKCRQADKFLVVTGLKFEWASQESTVGEAYDVNFGVYAVCIHKADDLVRTRSSEAESCVLRAIAGFSEVGWTSVCGRLLRRAFHKRSEKITQVIELESSRWYSVLQGSDCRMQTWSLQIPVIEIQGSGQLSSNYYTTPSRSRSFSLIFP